MDGKEIMVWNWDLRVREGDMDICSDQLNNPLEQVRQLRCITYICQNSRKYEVNLLIW